MNTQESLLEHDNVVNAIRKASDWLLDVAQIKEENLPDSQNPRGIKQRNWKGAFRGEYSVANKQWDTFCPIWHTGQALKALIMAYQILKDRKLLDGAILAAEFIGNNRITDTNDEDYGLILAYEGTPGEVNTSAIMEALDGLFLLSEELNEPKYQQWAIDALRWIATKTFQTGKGLFLDFYYPDERRLVVNPPDDNWNLPDKYFGRPLADDAVFLKGFLLTEDTLFKDIFFEVIEKLLEYKQPVDNWIRYFPCVFNENLVHPRQCYWWGTPMIDAYKFTGDKRYFHAAIQSMDWYRKALRKDGNLFRGTYKDFNTLSFGHAVSGTACAAIFSGRIINELESEKFRETMNLAITCCLKMQLQDTEDPNLCGAILEKVNAPDGTDRHPFHIRDLGTIFFIQAATEFLRTTDK